MYYLDVLKNPQQIKLTALIDSLVVVDFPLGLKHNLQRNNV